MWNSYPILRPTIALLLGMVGANVVLGRVHFSIYIPFALFALSVVCSVCLFYRKNKSVPTRNNRFGAAALAAFFFLGATLAHWRFISVEAHTIDSRKCRFGVVDSQPVEKTKWWTFQFRENDGAVYMAYLAKGDSTDHVPPELLVGDSIWLVTYFDMPTSPFLKSQRQTQMDQRKHAWKLRKQAMEVRKKVKKAEREAKKNKDNIKTSKRRNNKRKKDSDNEGMSTAASDAAGREDRSKYDGYSNYLFFHGFSSVIYCSEGAWGFCYDDPGQQADFRRQLAENKDIASAMHERYASAGFSEEANAIVDAMTTGNKTEISKQLRQQFSDAGISHVLALSGFHLTVIVSLIDVLLLRGVFSRRWRRMSALLVIPFIWAFAYIAGFPPSLVRATIMCSVFQLALVVGHGQQLKNAAAIAGFFMIAFSPMIIMDVGFQLSFLSIVGIAVMGAPLCTWLGQKTGRWAYVLDILCISLTCTLFTFPVVAYHFGQVPLYSLLSNLFVSLIATLIMWAAVFWWIFSWCNPVCGLLTSVLNGLTRAMVFVAESVSQLPMATVKYSPNILEVICLYLVIGYVLVYSYNKKRKYLGISALMMLLVPVVHYML